MRQPLPAVFLGVMGVTAILLAGCGDPPTSDHRGYTKAPLETPGIRVVPERPSIFRQYAHPRLPDGQPIVLKDSATAG